ncbi:MAG: Xaa-Pro peptidase family protein [Pirellulaceae bacterium]
MTEKTYSARINRLRKLLKAAKLPGMLVSNHTNVTYLTGFSGDASYLLVTAKELIIISDSRFTTQLAEECPGLKCEIRSDSGGTIAVVADVIRSLKVSNLGFESQAVTMAQYEHWKSLFSSVELVAQSGLVEGLRAVKDSTEIEKIRKAIEINERAFAIIRQQLRGNQTEREVAHNLENEMRAMGATGCAFPAIVAVGDRAALPHATPGHQRIEESSFVLVDWGTRNDGYVSDLTRMIIHGKPNAKFKKIYDVVLGAQLAAIRLIKPGVDCQVVDAAARSFIAKAGFGKYFGHGLGHGIGVQVHESPYFSPTRKGVLEEGMVVTVEPGIYLPEFGGVREDDVLVTRDGFEVLSQTPKSYEESIITLI